VVVPGNAGTQALRAMRQVRIDDIDSVLAICEIEETRSGDHRPSFLLFSEWPTRLVAKGFAVFGSFEKPRRNSKAPKCSLKRFLSRHNIPQRRRSLR